MTVHTHKISVFLGEFWRVLLSVHPPNYNSNGHLQSKVKEKAFVLFQSLSAYKQTRTLGVGLIDLKIKDMLVLVVIRDTLPMFLRDSCSLFNAEAIKPSYCCLSEKKNRGVLPLYKSDHSKKYLQPCAVI